MTQSHKKMMLSQQKVPKNLHNMCKKYSQKTKGKEHNNYQEMLNSNEKSEK